MKLRHQQQQREHARHGFVGCHSGVSCSLLSRNQNYKIYSNRHCLQVCLPYGFVIVKLLIRVYCCVTGFYGSWAYIFPSRGQSALGIPMAQPPLRQALAESPKHPVFEDVQI